MRRFIDAEQAAEMLRIHCGFACPNKNSSDVAKGYRLAYEHIIRMVEDQMFFPSVMLPDEDGQTDCE